MKMFCGKGKLERELNQKVKSLEYDVEVRDKRIKELEHLKEDLFEYYRRPNVTYWSGDLPELKTVSDFKRELLFQELHIKVLKSMIGQEHFEESIGILNSVIMLGEESWLKK